MQIKSILPLLTILFFAQIGFGQSWFSPSSNWYNQYSNFSIEGYAHLSFESDTILDNVACKKFSLNHFVYDYINGQNSNYSLSPIYFTETDGVAQLFLDEQFDTIININAQIGEYWEFNFESIIDFYDMVHVRVDVQEKDNIIVNDHTLQRLMVLYTYSYRSFGMGDLMNLTKVDTLIERSGNTGMFIDPREFLYGTLDAHKASALRCYTDQDIGTYQHDFSTDCDFVVPVIELQAKEYFRFFPNPTTGQFALESSSSIQQVDCYNINGQFVRSLKPQGTLYDLSGLPAGLYSLRIQSAESSSFHTIVKQ